MEFVCDKNALLKEISVAQEVVSTKNSLSVLSNIFMTVDGGTLTIRSTDLKVSCISTMPVDQIHEGETTVFCDKFVGILRTLPDGDVNILVEENGKVIIRPSTRKITFNLKSTTSDRFPELPYASESEYFRISQTDFIEMITQTVFAVSDDETRYFMNGVFMEKEGNMLRMVATDGRRLSIINKEYDDSVQPFSGIIIPPKVLNLVRKLCSGEGEIALAVTEKHIFFDFDNQHLSSSLIEGQFPNYKRVIPSEQPNEITLQRDEFLEAINRVAVLVEQKSRRVYFAVEPNLVRVQSEESELGTAKEEISCVYTGSNVTIALNYLYVRDPLRVINAEKVTIRFSEPNKALTISSSEGSDFMHIVMPMQID